MLADVTQSNLAKFRLEPTQSDSAKFWLVQTKPNFSKFWSRSTQPNLYEFQNLDGMVRMSGWDHLVHQAPNSFESSGLFDMSWLSSPLDLFGLSGLPDSFW